jgi:hypothetical protein
MAKSKATHTGTCQACGREQKLPKGTLSTHGYTVQWQMFLGICRGTGSLPYEQSRELIATLIEEVKGEIAHLTKNENENYTFYRSIRRSLTDRFKSADPERVTVVGEEHVSGDYKWMKFYFLGTDGTRKEISADYSIETVLGMINKLRSYDADGVRSRIKQLEAYVTWQEGRYKNWKLQPLKAVADIPVTFKVGVRRNPNYNGVTVTFPDGTKQYASNYRTGADLLANWKPASNS